MVVVVVLAVLARGAKAATCWIVSDNNSMSMSMLDLELVDMLVLMIVLYL